VFEINAAGYSQASLYVPIPYPLPPADLASASATQDATAGSVLLHWTYTNPTPPRTGNPTDARIFRGPADGPCPVRWGGVEIFRQPGDRPTYRTDPSVLQGHTYCYTLLASNPGGVSPDALYETVQTAVCAAPTSVTGPEIMAGQTLPVVYSTVSANLGVSWLASTTLGATYSVGESKAAPGGGQGQMQVLASGLASSPGSGLALVPSPGSAQMWVRSDCDAISSAWVGAPVFAGGAAAPHKNAGWSGTWTLRTNQAGAWLGARASTSQVGATASFSVGHATQLALVGGTGTADGQLDVLIDGTRVATIDTHAASESPRQVLGVWSIQSGSHTLAVVNDGGTGSQVELEGVLSLTPGS
jgi:hypothetical protein